MRNAVATVLFACLASCDPAVAQDLNVREFRRVADLDQTDVADVLPWYAGESVGYSILARRDRRAVQIPDGSVPVWFVAASTSAPPYVVLTGTVVNATNGEVRFWLPAPRANLPAGNYLSFATVYQGTNRVGVLDRATVRVSWRPGDAFEVAPPLTNVIDQVAGWYADAMSAVADAISNLTAHAADVENPHRVTAEQIGALTAEADEAGLAAAAGVQGNLTAHAEDVENPHQVTAEQIGALTAEIDPAFASWEPSAHVPVVCSGGWLYPDYFTLSTTPYAETGVAYSTTSDYNSVLFAWQIISPQKGEILSPSIVHHQDWTTSVSFTNAEVLEIREADGTFYADWPAGTSSGTVGRVTAVLGAFSRTLELTFGGATAAKSNAWWVADLPGSFRASVNAAVSNMAHAAGKSASVFSPWPYTSTNAVFIRNPDCWAASLDLTCASPWNSFRYPYFVNGTAYIHNVYGNYHAGTAITPQHFLYAEHFAVPTNVVFRWIDATNGIHDRTLVAQRFIGNDIAIGLLDAPLPASIAPAKCLAADNIGVLRGKHGLKNAPGFRLINLDRHEYAWQVASPFMENALESYPEALYATGSTNLPYSRAAAVGGDSGNPIFLPVGTNVVLLSTFWTASGGPMLPFFRAPIEAAMVEMGGSAYTNWPAADLSTWTNYDVGYALPDL